jgi:hypothetical protein
MIAAAMPTSDRDGARSSRHRGVRWALALVLAALAILAWAPAGLASPQDPCTAGNTCTTTCTIDADRNGGTCTVRECGSGGACAESTTIVPETSTSPPSLCTSTLSTCDIISTIPTVCFAAADGFGAECRLAILEWRYCALACSLLTVGGDTSSVGGVHYVAPAQAPAPTQPTQPTAPAPEPAPTTTPPAEPVPTAPAPTAPGQPAPPAPAPAPSEPQDSPATRRVANRIVIPFRSGFQLPPGIRRGEACRGRVRVVLRIGRRVIAVQTVRLNRRCRYTVTFRIRRARLRGARTVTVFARFAGNAVLGAAGRVYRLRIPRS